MERANIKCVYCKGKDFEIIKSEIPRGMQLECKKCRRKTPLAIIAKRVDDIEVLPVNGRASMELYKKAHEGDITYPEMFHASRKDKTQL